MSGAARGDGAAGPSPGPRKVQRLMYNYFPSAETTPRPPAPAPPPPPPPPRLPSPPPADDGPRKRGRYASHTDATKVALLQDVRAGSSLAAAAAAHHVPEATARGWQRRLEANVEHRVRATLPGCVLPPISDEDVADAVVDGRVEHSGRRIPQDVLDAAFLWFCNCRDVRNLVLHPAICLFCFGL